MNNPRLPWIIMGICVMWLIVQYYKNIEYFVEVMLHSESPKIMKLEGFLSKDECEHIISLCDKRFNRSNVLNADGKNSLDKVRTSSSCFMQEGETEIIREIEKRAAEVAGVPIDNIEGFQVVRYHPGEKYDAHNDWFHHESTKNQRYVTILVYLNDNFEGGKTNFVNLGIAGEPRTGDAMMWYNCEKNDVKSCYEDAKHQGSPPTTGIKYALNIWIRFDKYRNVK